MRRVVLAVSFLFAVIVPLRADAQAVPTVQFITPSNGATVAGPVEVALSVTGLNLVPAGSQTKDGLGHAHLLIDQEPPAVRSFLPTNDPNVVHLGTAPFDSRAVELSNGRHTLYAVLGDSDHLVIAHQPARITITVAPGLHAKGNLENACADIAKGSGDIRVAFPIAGGLLQGTISSNCVFATNGGACTWTDSAFRRINGTWNPSTRALAGTAPGYTTRQLKSGSRGKCGDDVTTPLGKQAFTATVAGGAISGTFGRSAFTLTEDENSRLASGPPVVLAAAKKAGHWWMDYWPFAAAAAVLAGAAYYAYLFKATSPPA